jgi:3-hydroxybutyryl-CoA dehydrogenase
LDADPPAPRGIERIGILGAGTMGAGIAQVVAEAGIEAVVHDPVAGAYERAAERIAGFLARKVDKGQLGRDGATAAIGRLSPAGSLAELAETDLVIEAIPEELTLKQAAFRELDATADASTILATNTSSLSVAEIGDATQRPARVVGMHFFNPVPLMALVEVVAAPRTAPAVADAVTDLARRLGKTPVLAADTPGFIVNRVARPFYLEALRIVGDGLAGVEQVDEAIRAAGFRMGPFELIDTIGADVNLAVSRTMYEATSEPRYEPHPLQAALVESGRLGRKAGAGFYDYEPDGARVAPWSRLRSRPDGAVQLSGERIAGRILAAIVNEAASAVADGVATPEAVDTAMRLGANYPEGPLAWGERVGLASVVATLDDLEASVPDGRHRVVPMLRAIAGSGASFFGWPQ